MTGTHVANDVMQVVILGLGDDIFAVEAGQVREIIDPVPVTQVAGARPHLAALINVRGNVIPLADIRARFDIPQRPASTDTRIVVLELTLEGDPVVVGVLADKVCQVTELPVACVQPPPRIGLRWDRNDIRAIAYWQDDVVILPDLEKILT